MKDFRSYSDESGKNKTGGENSGAKGGADVNNTINMVNALASMFSGKSEGDIWKTVLAQAEQGKRDGTLTNADLDAFYSALSPLLDGFRRQKLKSVINKLKNV